MNKLTVIAIALMATLTAFAESTVLTNVKKGYEEVPQSQKEQYLANTIISYSSARIALCNRVKKQANKIIDCCMFFKSGDDRRTELKRIGNDLLDARNRFYRLRSKPTAMMVMLSEVEQTVSDLTAVDTDDNAMVSILIPQITAELENVMQYAGTYDEVIEWANQMVEEL